MQDQELLDSYARLDAKKHTTTSKQFEHWQKATGWTWSKNALLLSQPLLEKGLLKPCHQFCHDWMHGILQGTAPVVLYHTLAIVSQEGLPVWSMLERYTKEWVLPAAWKCGHVHQLFDKKKVEKYKNSQRFACQASECLTLFPLVRHFLHTLVAKHGQCLEACEAFFCDSHSNRYYPPRLSPWSGNTSSLASSHWESNPNFCPFRCCSLNQKMALATPPARYLEQVPDFAQLFYLWKKTQGNQQVCHTNGSHQILWSGITWPSLVPRDLHPPGTRFVPSWCPFSRLP